MLLLNKFKWGHAFLSLNRELMALYTACLTSADVIAVQNGWLTAAPAYGLAEGEGEGGDRGEHHAY